MGKLFSFYAFSVNRHRYLNLYNKIKRHKMAAYTIRMGTAKF